MTEQELLSLAPISSELLPVQVLSQKVIINDPGFIEWLFETTYERLPVQRFKFRIHIIKDAEILERLKHNLLWALSPVATKVLP